MKNMLVDAPNPQHQLRDWQRRLRHKINTIELQIRDAQREVKYMEKAIREVKGTEKAIREAAKRKDMGSDMMVEMFPAGGRTSRGNQEWGIAREMEETRRTWEEIVIAEILRRRELEEEAIREMIAEREIFPWRGSEGLFPEDSFFPASSRRGGIGIFEERSAVIDGRLPLMGRPEIGVLEELPFQRGPAAIRAPASKPIVKFSKEQILQSAKSTNSSFVGVRRKFEPPITEGGNGTPSVNLSKKSKKEWYCAVCQVIATSEQGLNNHLNGTKHKGKHQKLSTVSDNDNSDALAEETRSSNELVLSIGNMKPNKGKCRDGNLVEVNDFDAMKEHKVQHNTDLKMRGKQAEMQLNTNFKCWCTMCQVGTTSEALMTAHRAGKKHMTLLQKLGGAVIAIKNMPGNIHIQYFEKIRGTAVKGVEESLVNENEEADRAVAAQK